MGLKLIKFEAKWCNPCKKQETEFEDNPIGIDIQRVNIDSTDSRDIQLVKKYRVMSIPTMVIIDDDNIVRAKFIGLTPSNEIKEAVVKIREKDKGRFVIIEDFNGTVSLVTDPDLGDVLVFETSYEAEEEAKNCQNGKVVKL